MWTNMRQKPGSVIDTFKEAFIKKAVTILWIGRFTDGKKSQFFLKIHAILLKILMEFCRKLLLTSYEKL